MRILPPPIGKYLLITVLAMLSSLSAFAQTIKVTGTVVDSSDEPLTGATVLVKGTQDGVSTDFNGNFTINAPKDGTLVVSYIGFATQEVQINGRTSITIVLNENTTVLDEVVAVGYGAQKKVNMTGAVSSVKVGALEDRPITNATSALAGLAAGLTVTNSGGNTPGYESQTIRIRGVGTTNNASPLVVIDGMPNASISDINPQDIESISVLKDAASSAIYGSRAANGVILITTKKGQEGTARITYSGNVSFETVAHRLNILSDYATYMEVQNMGLENAGMAKRFSQEKIDEWRNDAGRNPRIYPNTDWQDHIFRNPSVVQNHNITVNGGTKTIRYNMSLGYVNNPGMVYHSDYERYQLRSNIEADLKPWITAGMNIYGFIDANNPSGETATNGGDVIWGSGAFSTCPGMNLYDKETDTYGGVQNPEDPTNQNFNPYRRMWFYKTEFPVRTRRIVPKFFVRIKPIDGLSIEASYTYNWWSRNEEYHITDRNLYRYVMVDGVVTPILSREGTVRTYNNRYNYRNLYRTSDIVARYEFKAFNDKLDASVMVGASQEYNRYETEGFLKYDVIDDNLTALDAFTTNGRINGNYNDWAMRSFFGRINLVWDNKYLLEANIRRDGSSRFAPSNRWGWFPSVSAGWRVSEEHFMESTRDWLSSLKLRASYGSLGNNSIGNYDWQSTYAAANAVLGGTNVAGLAMTTLANKAVTWESTYMANVGFDYGFLNNRLTGSIEYYNKRTSGVLINLPAPLEHGTTGIAAQNAGEVVNNGIDLDIAWTDKIGKVTYTIGGNFGWFKNKMTKFKGDEPSYSGAMRLLEGHPIWQLYVLEVDRIVRDQKDLDYVESLVQKGLNAQEPYNYFANYTRPGLGDFLYKDTNGDGRLNADDRVTKGHGNFPSIAYGFNLGLQWNNFDFSMLLQGVGDYYVYYNNQAFRFVTVLGQSLNKDIVDNSWTPENPNAKYPKLYNNAQGKNQQASTAFCLNASYLRCKNIQLGYNVPKNITQKFFCENLKVYCSIDNLFTITSFPGVDPEVAATVGYPAVKQYSLGVNVSF